MRLAHGRAGGSDVRRPHQFVEVRVLPGEVDVVVPAGSDVVGHVLVYDRCDGAFGLQEVRPSEVDHRGEQPVLVAKVVVEGRRRDPGRVAHRPR